MSRGMSIVSENIFKTINTCHVSEEEDRTRLIDVEDDIEKVKNDTQDLIMMKGPTTGSIQYANLSKMLALSCFKAGDEVGGICHLIESHGVILRQHILHRHLKREIKGSLAQTVPSYGLNPLSTIFGENGINSAATLMSRLAELPKEWYTIMITAQHDSPRTFTSSTSTVNTMHPIHLVVLPTGCPSQEPFCITLQKPVTNTFYDVSSEMHKLLGNNRDELVATYANRALYWKMRQRQNEKLKEIIEALEYTWLREWRILFIADPVDKDELTKELMRVVDKLVADNKAGQKISTKSKWLLKKIICNACFLKRDEIARAVIYAIPNHPKLADQLILSIYGKLSEIEELKFATRKTLVLIVDENMDYIPFESMSILKGHPATRFPSLHVAYALFKKHESTIENGFKIIRVKEDMGTCIVNPSGNLEKMEARMRIFIEYWLPNWQGWYGTEPKEEMFENALINHDILMYNGHGSGIQYLAGEQIERLNVKSIVLLFGCNSVKLLNVGGRYPPYGISNQYLIASSPCVLGMLWEVTDADIDKMTTNFISSWIPSNSERPWSDVDLKAWCTGLLKFTNEDDGKTIDCARMEPEMLRAVAKSKDVCSHFMTAAAVVVRGLPIKLV